MSIERGDRITTETLNRLGKHGRILGTGGIIATNLPNGDVSVALAAGAMTGSGGSFAGTITVVTGTANATYDAVSLSGGVEVTGETPINRVFDTLEIDYGPAAVGDPCIMLKKKDGSHVLVVFEKVATIECDSVVGAFSNGFSDGFA